VHFNGGQALATIVIDVLPDTLDEPNETFAVNLTGVAGGSLGTPSTATVTITDNDVAGKVQLSASTYTVSEGDGTATITVTRTGGTSSGATVNYNASGGSATVAIDYGPTSGTLTFAAGQTTQTFTVTIVEDAGTPEPVKSVNLTLSTPGGGAVLGTPATAVLWIVDND
jgi:hypothetical protein